MITVALAMWERTVCGVFDVWLWLCGSGRCVGGMGLCDVFAQTSRRTLTAMSSPLRSPAASPCSEPASSWPSAHTHPPSCCSGTSSARAPSAAHGLLAGLVLPTISRTTCTLDELQRASGLVASARFSQFVWGSFDAARLFPEEQ